MAPSLARIASLLEQDAFDELFIDVLGWDVPQTAHRVVDEGGQGVDLVASKKGLGVWVGYGVPEAPVRSRLAANVARHTRERLLVFVDGSDQMWLWPEKRPYGSGYRYVVHPYRAGSSTEGLLQRLRDASFSMDEQLSLSVMDVFSRVRRSFNTDDVTARFFREFKNRHEELVHDVEGIADSSDLAWYGSVLMNRLMFIYFMQKKSFLDSDENYLSNRLARVREVLGPDSFYGFYRKFLLPLFHEGLGSHLHRYEDDVIASLVGDVPYINGGLFNPHLLETRYDISVPDIAFERIFEFFDRFRWHLDESPSEGPNEINPDVLGYIFEQYVNQKEQGAYYTKEDVTGYMTEFTVLPALLDLLDTPEGEPWLLLEVDPDRYIREALLHGLDLDLPRFIEEGIRDGEQRAAWAMRADPAFALAGETWWDVVDRRQHASDARRALARGEVGSIEQAVKHNIDLQQLVVDYFRSMFDPGELERTWRAITRLTVLDPTCGSGAFLFAALDVLGELYRVLLEQGEAASVPEGMPKFVHDASTHPSRSFYALRAVMLNNLFGLDLNEEAVEIARLRMFLKLAAQLNSRSEIETLPDLDFNIRAGNLLVGIAAAEDVSRFSDDLLGFSHVGEIEEVARGTATAFDEYARVQRMSGDPVEIERQRTALIEGQAESRRSTDGFLHEARGESGDVESFVESHSPFHWFLEFPGVFARGGFDVVVGNPPYISRGNVDGYRYVGFRTNDAPDIYAVCMERSLGLLRSGGWFSMIVPHSVSFSSKFVSTRAVLREELPQIWVSSYARIPAGLFSSGVRVRNSIVLGSTAPGPTQLNTTRCRRWIEAFRPHLLQTIRYATVPEDLGVSQWPFLGSERLGSALSRLVQTQEPIAYQTVAGRGFSLGEDGAASLSGPFAVSFKQSAYNWVSVFIDPPPAFDGRGEPIAQSKMGSLWFDEERARDAALLVLAGKLGFAWWVTFGDDFDVTAGLLGSLPVDLGVIERALGPSLDGLTRELRDAMGKNIVFKRNAGKDIGNYHLGRCRSVTDRADVALLAALGCGAEVEYELGLVYHQTIRTAMTDEAES